MGVTLTGILVFDKAEHPDDLARRVDRCPVIDLATEIAVEELDGSEWFYGSGDLNKNEETYPLLVTWIGKSTRVLFFENAFSLDTPQVADAPETYRKLVKTVPGASWCGVSMRELTFADVQANLDDIAWLQEQGIERYGAEKAEPVA